MSDLLSRARELLERVWPYSKAGNKWDEDHIQWRADYSARPEMAVDVWKSNDEFGWWRWDCVPFGVRSYCKFHDKDSAIADANRVAVALGLRCKIEETTDGAS